jgi:hypothetical protein
MAYSYLLVSSATGKILCEAPLTGVSFEQRLNGTGTFQGNFPIGDSRVTLLDPKGSSQGARTLIYVDRNHNLVYAGMLWAPRYDSASKAIQLQGAELVSYLAHRHVNWTANYVGIDQCTIVGDLLTNAQAAGWISGLTWSVPARTYIGRTVQYNPWEKREILNEITTISTAQYGMDWATTCQYDSSGNPTANLGWYYPRKGVTSVQSGYVFDYPGNITSYTWPEDGILAANTVHAVGAGSGNTTLLSTQANPNLVTNGYPLLEAVKTYKNVQEQNILNDLATANLIAYQNPPVNPVLTVRADLAPMLGTYTVGDEVNVQITDEFFPNGMSTFLRIQSIMVTPGEGSTPETVKLTLGPVVPT